jgi:hypothetical protein
MKNEYNPIAAKPLTGIVLIVGNYGSGKTEVAVNLAAAGRMAGLDVAIADIDLVNPYFRAREVRGPLNRLGVNVVLPPVKLLHADLPVLTPAVSGLLRQPRQLTILDVGGNDVGAMVLAALADSLKDSGARMLQVVNPFRPFTDTPHGCLQIRHAIEKAARLSVDGIIANPHLIDDTQAGDVMQGYDFVEALARSWHLPLEFIAVKKDILPLIDHRRFDCPLLPIARQLVPPWRKTESLEAHRQGV